VVGYDDIKKARERTRVGVAAATNAPSAASR
jgi:hypothetical protein